MYQSLDLDKISATVVKLEQRIKERFPDSGLLNVAGKLHQICDETGERTRFITQPQHWLRAIVAAIVVLTLSVFVYAINGIEVKDTPFGISDLIQIIEASLNAVFLIGAAIFFLVTVETRIKTQRALVSLHELRSIAHIIDMHQLTKDPVQLTGGERTDSSPERTMTAFEIQRYLDYCSELLSLTGKLAAIFCQSINDRSVITSAIEIEQLTTNLSRKMWQKIANLPRE